MIPSSDLYLFRVGHDDSASHFIEGTGIIPSSFCTRTSSGPRQLTHTIDQLEDATWGPGIPFDTVTIQHMRHRSRIPTPFISTTASLPWAIWEAERQLSKGDQRVRLFAIDAIAVNHHAERAVDKIDKFISTQFRQEYFDFFKFASSSQEVLVDYYIPSDAITWIWWQSLREILPSWFFRSATVAFRTYDDRHPPFKEWTNLVGCRFSKENEAGGDEWVASSYREAAAFAFTLFASQIEAESPIGPGVTMRKRALINRATAVAFALLPKHHKLIADSHPTKFIEQRLLQLTLDKWPKVSHPLTPQPVQGPAMDNTISDNAPVGGHLPSNTLYDDEKQDAAGQEGSTPEVSYILEGIISVIGIKNAYRRLFAFART